MSPVVRRSLVRGLRLGLLVTAGSAVSSHGQVNYTGGGYVQNFDALNVAPNNTSDLGWTDNSTLPGWFADRSTYAVTNGTLGGTAAAFDNAGIPANNGLFSFGTAGSADRALGTRSADGRPVRFAVRLVNQTGRTLTRFSVAYTGEQWFKSSAATPHKLAVDYLFDAVSLQDGAWAPIPALTFTSPVITPVAAALNGNAVANRTPLVATVSGVAWEPGRELWIRFSDHDEPGVEQGLAVDDFAVWTGEDSAVYFGGGTGYVAMGPAPSLGLGAFTLECWFLETGAGTVVGTGTGGVTGRPLITKGRNEADGSNVDCNYFLGLDTDGHLVADFEAMPALGIPAGENFPLTGVGRAIPGAWNHAAVTYDSTGWRLYLNGELDAIGTPPFGALPREDSIQHFGIGTALNSTGVAAGFFQGVIDEVRIWNRARSSEEILATRDLPITTFAPNLVARYALNEGTGPTVTGQIPGAPEGTLAGGTAWAVGRRFAPNLSPTVELTSPVATFRPMFPATVPFAADARDPDGTIVKVEFLVDSRVIGEVRTAPYTFDWQRVPAGTHTVLAAATDNSGTRVTSAPVTILVEANPNRPPTLAAVGPAADATGIGATTTLAVTLADPERAPVRVTFYGRRSPPPLPGPDFTLGTLPDTQYYTLDIPGRSRQFYAQSQWYADNSTALNLAFVSHMGDLCEHGDFNPSTAQSNLPEWLVADAAMKVIEDPLTTLHVHGIPWGVAPGNHDQSPTGSVFGTTALYNQFFGVDRFAGRIYYGGHFGGDNNNSYQLFRASGMDFIIFHLGFDTRALALYEPVLAWADAVLKANPSRRAIVTTHWIVSTGNPAAFSAQGRIIYDYLKNNPNLFLMLGGHIPGEGRRSDVYQGRTIHSVLQNYQSRVNGGDGWLRTYTFSPARNTIGARTYSPTLGRAESDADSEFSLPYDMQSAITPWTPLGTVDVAAGGTSATAAWSGLEPGSSYEWYAAAQDEINTTTSPPRRLVTTATNPITVALTAPIAGTRLPIPATVRLTADAKSDAAITRVDFYQGNTKVGEDTTAPYEYTWSNPVTGDYALSALATDATGAYGRSRGVTITVFNPSNRAPTVALTAPTPGTRVTTQAALTLTAAAADSDGTIARVEFFNGTTKLGESRTAPYTFVWNGIAVGTYTITARATDNDGGVTTSNPVSISVVPPVVTPLIAANSNWKYLDDGSDQGTAWRTPAFNDSTWPSGPAELGYGDGDETTVIGFGLNPASRAITAYFRRTFVVADPARIGQLVLNLVRDDGAIVYLNGTEIGRSAMTVGATYAYNTLAPTAVAGADERTFFPLVFSTDPRPLLVRGNNTLAVEVHQQAIANPDLSFNLELLDQRVPVGAPPAVALTAPPPGAIFSTQSRVALAASASDSDGTIAKVEFNLDGTKLGETTRSPYVFDWTATPAGAHVLTATAFDNDGNAISSAPVPVLVRESDPGRFVNFSIRNNVGSAASALIIGFVTGGAGNQQTKPLLLRAVGPTLAAFGVDNFSPDPAVTLAVGSTILAANDNWEGDPQVISASAQVGAFPLAAPDSRDAALVVQRPPGAQTLQITGAAGTALAEIYDATPIAAYTPDTPRLINVSARAMVGANNNELIAGVVVGGSTSRTVLLRAIGPGLTRFGITNALVNPRLEVYRAGNATAIASNDNWGGGAVLATAMVKVGAFSLTPLSRDAAVLVNLAPGAYTARVTGTPGSSGVALVDIYEVP